ncbi:molybdopterin cofactor-binding domain-containing protein [Pelagerythrobacter rhizovicinus]|uniref:Xanthine dehydrogenase family protein molybdopterin-binding subunit n=1 Tax=Pelagerythrobacter rhizovicinus TaxID=2268576 RepID=A0A4Q2KLN1_9SPHN|nr:molybdopterin cofactor-binding domain-containing protein [Pelagerythrobacter rhizovicinus]RXZ64263.1 xanthine dehydrogenase family protein molybdopterin-binding subunit [Pelagerythrobacter rhizovicinus]
MQVSRRGILVGAAVGGGLLVAWALRPRTFPDPLPPGRGEYAFGAWLKIARDGVVTVAVPQLEMGQGVTTILPQVVAVELGADWRQIAVEPAPPSGAYANVPLAARWAPLWMPLAPGLAGEPDDLLAKRYAQEARFAATAEGTTLAAYERPCREAAASARAVLCMAAADRWGVAWEECEAADGLVRHGEKRLRFAELAEEAAELAPPDPPPLRPLPASETPIAGEADAATSYPRLDLPAKVDGSFLFAGDVRLPGMVYAAIRHGPVAEAKLSHFEPRRAAPIAELVQVVEGKRWLAAVATNWWAADRAVEAMRPRFRVTAPIESGEIEATLDDAIRRGTGEAVALRGDGAEWAEAPDLALRYDVAPGTHATLETASATARFADGRLELWIASQAPERARGAAAEALGLSISDVILYPMAAGGSFDRRLEHDHAIEAALIAREVGEKHGRPVQLVWSRWEEQLAGRPRAPVSAIVSARVRPGGNGEVTALRVRLAMQPAAREFGRRLFDNETSWAAIRNSAGEIDHMVTAGALPPYAIPNATVEHIPVTTGMPSGRMRANSHGYTAFFIECFLDELAARNGREPLSYRVGMLGDDARMVECLQRVARLAEWDGGLDQSGKGLACHRMGEAETGGRIACIATARQDEGGVRVTRLAAAVDIGRIVNIGIARQQIEGGLVFGMAQALGAAVEYRQGLPVQGRLADLNLPLLADVPEIEVDFVASEAEPFDPGELGVAVAAPAIANALHSATGLRLRRLPLLSGGL